MPLISSRRSFGRWAGAAAITPWLAACGGGGDDGSGAAAVIAASMAAAQARERAYDQAVQHIFDTYHPPGILLGVQAPNAAPWLRAYGLADVANGTPLSLNSSFPIRSITKSFTVTLLLQLVKEGRVALDDKIGRYIDGVPNGHLITLADLAGNQSGLADYSQQRGFLDVFVQDLQHVWAPQDLLDLAFAANPEFQPGEQYQYSNTNTVLLGVLIEKLSAQPLADVLAQRIFTPLGLRGTLYPHVPELPAPTPQGYAVDINTGVIDEQPAVSPTSLAGSGAIASTLSDLLAWGQALGQGTLLTPALQARRIASARTVTNGPEYQRYALGIGQIGDWWGHTGSGIGFQVATMNHAASNTTIAVIVNASPEGGRRDLNLAQEVFEGVAGV